MNIRIEKDPVLNRWWVHMDLWAASFRSLDEAQSFVQRLNARISAPHSLSMLSDRPLGAGLHSYGHQLDLGFGRQSVTH